jgi:3',5'-cyclic AMP phosphodiesterase CpdA
MLKGVIVAQISDMHVKRRGHFLHHMPHVAQPLRRVLAAIARLRPAPDCIVATGDLTESGTLDEYARLREILKEHAVIPVFLLPGNHDRLDALSTVFWDEAYLREPRHGVLFTVERQSWRLIALDSSKEERAGGYLSQYRLEWLRHRLNERRDTMTILAMHHPPFRTGIGRFDRQAFHGREELARIVRMHPQIARIICGHIHQPRVSAWCGTVGMCAPSTAPTLVLHPRAPGVAWEPGGFLCHRYERATGVTTSLIRVAAKPVLLSA